MRRKSLVLIVIAAGCGLIASIGISQVLENQAKKGDNEVETVDIFVTKVPITVRDVITEELVALEKWPKDKVPPDAVTDWEVIDGRRPNVQLFEGEPIRTKKLVDPDQTIGATDRIRKGYRGLSVKVTYEMTSGLLQPGDMVDVLVVFRQGGGITRTVVKTILQNVPIFAVNEKIIRETNIEGKVVNARTVTLEVTPEQAEKVTLAMKMGDLSLSMRSPGDDVSINYGDGTGLSKLLGEVSEVVEPPKPVAAGPAVDDFMKFASREGQLSPTGMGPAKPEKTMDIIGPDGSTTYEIFTDGSMPREILPFGSEADALDAMAEEDYEPDSDELPDDEDDGGDEALGEYDLPDFGKAGR